MVFVMTAVAVTILSYDLEVKLEPSSNALKSFPRSTEKTPLIRNSLTMIQDSSAQRKLHFIVYLCFFSLSAITLSGLLAYSNQTPGIIALECVLLLIILGSLGLIRYRIPLKIEETDGSLSFSCPGKPFVQGASILINLILMFHLSISALQQLLVYGGVGIVIYFSYGIFFSKITLRKQTQKINLIQTTKDDSDPVV